MIMRLGESAMPEIVAGQHVYPEAMREGADELMASIRTGLSLGWVTHSKLVGWILCEFDYYLPHTTYIHDLVVLPKYQHRRIATKLWKATVAQAFYRGLDIRLHARPTSHGIILSSHEHYSVIKDQLIPDYYAIEYYNDALLGEDAWEVLLVRND